MNNRILIVDDHPAVRMAVQLLLASEGFYVVAETDNGVDALELIETLRPSILILDIGILMVDGLTVISRIVEKKFPVKVIVLTGLPSSHLAERCRQIGAQGFVSKQNELSELVHAIRAVRANQQYFPSLSDVVRRSTYPAGEGELLTRLSVREYRVMQQLVQGLNNKEIADSMQLSNKTVSTYKKRLFDKLNVNALVELYALAKRNGIV
ncbi:response regulator [Pseudomonas sp. McL0111]|uniref:response regulator n=1 Tax=Pseudomonas sp. McL0111 TaxID=3457357 RepID=UPI00403E8879